MQATLNDTSPKFDATVKGTLTASIVNAVTTSPQTFEVPVASSGVSSAEVQQIIDNAIQIPDNILTFINNLDQGIS